jgi:uncharacterized protein YoxC
MTGGEIAVVILAASSLLLVVLIGFPLVKLGKLLDQTAATVTTFNAEFEPILAEAKTTLAEANKQLKRVDNITKDVEQVTTNISSLVAVFTASVGGPLTKMFGVVQGVAKVFGKRR